VVQLLRHCRDQVARGGAGGALLVRAGHVLFTWRDLVFPVVLLAAAVGTVPTLAGPSTSLDHVMDGVGFLVALTGQAWRVIVIGLQYITRGGQNRRIWANTLVHGGVFAHCRNPLYLGNFLILAGLAIVHHGWAMYLVVLPFFMFAYSALVRSEEEYLAERFGEEYSFYCARVPRWWPIMSGWRETLRGGRLDWLKVLRKEYGTPFAWGSGCLLLLVWEHHAVSADPIGGTEFATIAAAWSTIAIAYVTTRTLKLRGRLGRD
jgi:protein-S-isoprenylcysteine O-methyltransferase Ste14